MAVHAAPAFIAAGEGIGADLDIPHFFAVHHSDGVRLVNHYRGISENVHLHLGDFARMPFHLALAELREGFFARETVAIGSDEEPIGGVEIGEPLDIGADHGFRAAQLQGGQLFLLVADVGPHGLAASERHEKQEQQQGLPHGGK